MMTIASAAKIEPLSSAQATQPLNTIQLGIQSCYLQASRFNREIDREAAPELLTTKPEIRCEFHISHCPLKEKTNCYAVTLTFYIGATHETQSLYHLEVSQVGIFMIDGVEDKMVREQLFNGYCASLLYPFVRQAVAEMTLNAQVMPLQLPIINFEGEYQQRKAHKLSQTKAID